jgi:hypothetical protein
MAKKNACRRLALKGTHVNRWCNILKILFNLCKIGDIVINGTYNGTHALHAKNVWNCILVAI